MELVNPPNRFDWTKSTVSIFYMPIIAHAFLIASKNPIPKSVISSTGNLINLFNNSEIGQKTRHSVSSIDLGVDDKVCAPAHLEKKYSKV